MATGRLPAPGTDLGPCRTSCQHRDCAETRRQAESNCRHCGKPIGYETRFYAPEGFQASLVHADCHEDALTA